MSDYIPTTADVRDAFSSESTDSTYANRMFDLWLAQYKAKIVAKTEERIIKLLEDKIASCDWEQVAKDAGYDDQICDGCDENRAVIALIKGENK